MAIDEHGDDERPRTDPPLHPDDRLWRHPSELAGGTPVPAAWPMPVVQRSPRRSLAVAALASACLAGAAVAMGVMWFAGPTRVVVRDADPTPARAVTTAAFGPAAVPAASLAKRLAPSLVQVEAARGDQWTTGTGIRLDAEGTIAVASPLVEGAAAVMVTGDDGDRRTAVATGTDPATGITILTADGDQGTPVSAEPVDAEAGQLVAVIAATSLSPQGATQQRIVTATVSTVGLRMTVDPLVIHDAVQLDRALPDDATGGIVVDADGHLVGIVLTASGSDDLAVVVPAADAIAAAKGMRGDGEVRRAWMGVQATDLDPAKAEFLSLKGGALLTEVEAGSPAAAAGLQPGDVITSVDQQPVSDASDLVVALRAWKPGERVVVQWQRGTADDRAEVVLGG